MIDAKRKTEMIEMMIDVHAHLAAAEFDADRAEVLVEAKRAGVAAIVCVPENLADAKKLLSLNANRSKGGPRLGLCLGK